MPRLVIERLLNYTDQFTARMSEFSTGSKERIFQKLEEVTSRLHEIMSAEDYERLHEDFCEWFRGEIRTAQQTPASFGQAATVLDIALTACVHWGAQPSPDVAARIRPFLHGVIEVPIMNHLIDKYREPISAMTMEQVDEHTYRSLQTLVGKDMRDSFPNNLPVEYNDLIWEKLLQKNLSPLMTR